MRFAQRQRRVDRAEEVLKGRVDQARTHLFAAEGAWKHRWMPWAMLAAGVALGFAAGKARPLRVLRGGRWLQALGSFSTVLGSLRAVFAAWQAGQADQASVASEPPQASPPATATQTHPLDEAAEVQQWRSLQPRAAEAATELSER